MLMIICSSKLITVPLKRKLNDISRSILETNDFNTLIMLYIANSFVSFNSTNNYFLQKAFFVSSIGQNKVPNRKTLATSLLSNCYDLAIKEIVSKTSKYKSLAITCDG